MGYMDDAAAALRAAANQVPVNYLVEAEQQLGTVAQYAQQAGGQFGEAMAHEALATQSQVQELTAMLAGLQERLRSAANEVLAHGG
ncbi:hypothetical protein [Gandjariella thermophila]|uniref:PE domain-containing protein n=1 Tax=Gandjariella thermophila TaxID=1931992 RepID=A0A4D4J306_9PSEU|nr:hypothetical protein [Gandjariella thermophila]GDY29148.1 hypothetical protein GTS_07810 [Gandjariella thermophila]